MREKYKGKIGPADAMSALAPEFNAAYSKATKAIMDAVLEFERVTGRTVDSIAVGFIDVTTLHDAAPRHLRQASIHFLPTPGEVIW
jgi:hypothetical protein